MIVLDVICHARRHDSPLARRDGCVCPPPLATAVERSRVADRWRRKLPAGRRGRGVRGPSRRTVGHGQADEVAVERLAGGDRAVRAATAEVDLAIDRLDAYGYSARQVAVRLGITTRTVTRRRATRAQETTR